MWKEWSEGESGKSNEYCIREGRAMMMMKSGDSAHAGKLLCRCMMAAGGCQHRQFYRLDSVPRLVPRPLAQVKSEDDAAIGTSPLAEVSNVCARDRGSILQYKMASIMQYLSSLQIASCSWSIATR